jgi:DNA-directed RNA polymerase subunit omega
MDIISLPILIEKNRVDSYFRLVILASERARSLMSGAKPVIDAPYKKETTVALYEVLRADMEFVTGKEARKELRKYKATRSLEGMKTAAEKAKEEEVRSEVERDLAVYLSEADAAKKALEQAEE